MKHFADDPDRSFEFGSFSAHSAGLSPNDSADDSREKILRDGAGSHEAHASDPSNAARCNAKKKDIEGKEEEKAELELAEALYFAMDRLDPSESYVCFNELPFETRAFYRHSIMAVIELKHSTVRHVLDQVTLRRQLLRTAETQAN